MHASEFYDSTAEIIPNINTRRRVNGKCSFEQIVHWGFNQEGKEGRHIHNFMVQIKWLSMSPTIENPAPYWGFSSSLKKKSLRFMWLYGS